VQGAEEDAMRPTLVLLSLAVLTVSTGRAKARLVKRYSPAHRNEIAGGIGFAADLTAFTPGGFKWFNEYGHQLGGPTWINLQLNVTAGEGGRCYWHQGGIWVCDSWSGSAMELVLGAKLKWRVAGGPLQVHAKLGAASELIWFGAYHGTALAFRTGFGLRYFVVPELSVGGEIGTAVGPLFSRQDDGVELYGAIDLNLGLEWRF
jgi:hypothetical protein